MTRANGVLQQLTSWASEGADGHGERRWAARWGMRRSALAGFASVGEVVRTAWADPARASVLLGELAVLAAEDEVAAQAALAILAPRLLGVVGRWARAGVPPVELEDMAADLVAEALAALREPSSPRPPGAVVDVAWGRARARRSRERRRSDRQVELDPATAAADGRDVFATAAGVVEDGYRSARISLSAAQALWATGVAGWSAAEAAAWLGCRPDAVRARRSRAIRALAACGGRSAC